jgi:hypothetical protein
MITKDEVLSYINHIPTSNSVIQTAIDLLNKDNIEAATLLLQLHPAIIDYLQHMSHRGAICMKEANPSLNSMLIFFGSKRTKALLYTYMISDMLPKKWKLFNMSNDLFFELSAILALEWEKILTEKSPTKATKYIAAPSLLVSSIAICDSLFGAHRSLIDPLISISNIDFNNMLKNLTGMSLFDVAEIVGKKLAFDDEVIEILEYASGTKTSYSSEISRLALFLHMLLFHTLSRQKFIEAGLNSFIKFNSTSTEPILSEFAKIIEIEL